ncbi:MAG: hypothetical protein ABIQ44_02115 [Chloroflexia bacterium]
MLKAVNRTFAPLLALILLLTSFALLTTHAAPTAAPTVSAPSQIVGGVGNQQNPSLVGDTLVYDDCALPYLSCTLSAYDFTTQSTYQIANNIEYLDFQGAVQRTDGASVAWTSADKSLHAANLTDYSTVDLPATPAFRREVAVWGNLVVWTDGRAFNDGEPLNNDIYMLDRTTNKETAIVTDNSDQNHPATNGKVIVWQDTSKPTKLIVKPLSQSGKIKQQIRNPQSKIRNPS